jgi:hypothetical protein
VTCVIAAASWIAIIASTFVIQVRLSLLVLLAIGVPHPVFAQQSLPDSHAGPNEAMTALQPTWAGPMIQSDSRLTRGVRLSVSNSYAPGFHTLNFGNGHGVSVIALNRFQFDVDQPAYIIGNPSGAKDGFGDLALQVKARLASGNAQHGDYAVTAILATVLPTASSGNGALTSIYVPKLAVGKSFGRFNLQTVVNGVLPTGKIAAQGRVIEWNSTAQVHIGEHWFVDLENNAAWNLLGPFDGKPQNFVTPAAFYRFRQPTWMSHGSAVMLGGGWQEATSHFHSYNHNLILETRILF